MNDLARRIPLVVWTITILALIFIPLKILSYGYLPQDDLLADTAKAVCGKPWRQILVLKSDFKIDNHIGWHRVLRQLYEWTHWDDETLALFLVTVLAALVCLSGLPWLERPEAWLIALGLGIGVETSYMPRIVMGRPLLLSMAVLITILFLWKKRGQGPPTIGAAALMTVGLALAIYLHGIWYFWVLPIAAFMLAREFRWAIALTVCWIIATLVGAVLTGQPWTYLSEAWSQATNVMSRHFTQGTLVSELRPGGGSDYSLLLMGGLLILRRLANLPARTLTADPVFWLAALGWILEHQAMRFWFDWGAPALWVLIACDLEACLAQHLAPTSIQRLGVTAGLAFTVFLITTNDVDSRWTADVDMPYLSQNDPTLAGWLPGDGGIFYKAGMGFFFQTFFHNPNAPWRYMVGYEPVLMPPKDFDTYERLQWNPTDRDAYLPWVKEMRAADRMVIDARSNPSNYVPELEWKYAVGTMWLGRLPKHGQ